jgi:hypothetical protein
MFMNVTPMPFLIAGICFIAPIFVSGNFLIGIPVLWGYCGVMAWNIIRTALELVTYCSKLRDLC